MWAPALSLLPSIDAMASAKVGKPKNSDKALIVIWLGGGHASQETFAPTLDGPDVAKSTTGVVGTNVGGMYLGGTFPNLAKLANEYSLIHSLVHSDANHDSGTHFNMTGYMTVASDMAPSKNPSYGAVISKYYGANSTSNGIPTYVKANSIRHDGSAWLGIVNDGFLASDDGVKNLGLNTSEEQFKRRLGFINVIEKSNKLDNLQFMREWTDLRGQASRVIMGDAANAFKLQTENDTVKDKFGITKSNLGKQLLLARRLIESGTKCVTVHFGGWDHHVNIKQAMENVGAELDIYLSSLIEDLKDRNLLKDTMVLVMSEFSRTTLNNTGGRDHWPAVQSCLISGGDFNHGRIIGEMSKDRKVPLTKPIYPLDIMATVLTHFGIPLDYQIIDKDKRPRNLIEGDHACVL
jgi:hypothetical protein